MNLIAFVHDKLTHFANKNKILLYLVSSGVGSADSYTKGAIVRMLNQVGAASTDYEKTTIQRCLEQLALFQTTPVIFIASQGETFSFEIDKEADKDFTGYNLRVYNAEDGAALGPARAGNNDDKQEVQVTDLALTAGKTYRLNVVLETSDLTPDTLTLLAEVYLIVDPNIDTA